MDGLTALARADGGEMVAKKASKVVNLKSK
jgi:hypothetical protein